MNQQINKNRKDNLILEVFKILFKFFKSYGLRDKILDMPKVIRVYGYKIGIFNSIMTLIGITFAFMLKVCNLLIGQQLIILGLMIFILYRSQTIVRETFYLYDSAEREAFKLLFDDELVLKASQIIGKVTGKVLKYDSESNFYKTLSNEEVLNCLKNYISNVWNHRINHCFDIIQIINVIVMIIVSILLNEEIPQIFFIPTLLIFICISFLGTAYISIHRDIFYKKEKECNNLQSTLLNDILRVPAVIEKDLDMRISKFQTTVLESKTNIHNFHKKLNFSSLIISAIESLSGYAIIVFYIYQIGLENITLESITILSANLVIIETTLGYIRTISRTINSSVERTLVIEKEEADMKLILDLYNRELDSLNSIATKNFNNISFKPFSINYTIKSNNDIPFMLSLTTDLNINLGEIVILSGVSGSGKSTFMKLLTNKIVLKENCDLPSTNHYLFYDEKLKLGSMNIFEEIFCSISNPDLKKMEEILKNLHLWQEISKNCHDIWKWMKENYYGLSLSNGQNQRLIIAKLLYWLDESIDMIVLDEATSGLDDFSDENSTADANSILSYITSYCNKDKKRTIIISSHQNLKTFKTNMKNLNFEIKELKFVKEGHLNYIKNLSK